MAAPDGNGIQQRRHGKVEQAPRSELPEPEIRLLRVGAGEDRGADLVLRRDRGRGLGDDLLDDASRYADRPVVVGNEVVAGPHGDVPDPDLDVEAGGPPVPDDVARGEPAAPG